MLIKTARLTAVEFIRAVNAVSILVTPPAMKDACPIITAKPSLRALLFCNTNVFVPVMCVKCVMQSLGTPALFSVMCVKCVMQLLGTSVFVSVTCENCVMQLLGTSVFVSVTCVNCVMQSLGTLWSCISSFSHRR